MKNNSPEQRTAWALLKGNKGGSRFANTIPSFLYNPDQKPPSRRDLHRLNIKARKLTK